MVPQFAGSAVMFRGALPKIWTTRIGVLVELPNLMQVFMYERRSLTFASMSARNIGAVLDSNLSLVEHVNSVTRGCYMKLRQISHIRGYLTQEATATLVRSLITSKLDYVNSLLYGIPDALLHKLQLVQNNAARLVLRKKKSDHVTPLLIHLHWLPVKQRIIYKIDLITYKAQHGLAPEYLKELLVDYQPTRSLRSAARES